MTKTGLMVRTIAVTGMGRSRWRPWQKPHEYGSMATLDLDAPAAAALIGVDEGLRACAEYETDHNLKLTQTRRIESSTMWIPDDEAAT